MNILKGILFELNWFYKYTFKPIFSRILNIIAFLIRGIVLTILAGIVIIVIGAVGIAPLVTVLGATKTVLVVAIFVVIIWAFCRLENKR